MKVTGWFDVATFASGFPAGIRAARDDNDTVGIFGPGFQGVTAKGVTVRVPTASRDDALAVLRGISDGE
jgi:hypothetical protein